MERIFSLRTFVDGEKRKTPSLEDVLYLWGRELEDFEWEDETKRQVIMKLTLDANWGLTLG